MADTFKQGDSVKVRLSRKHTLDGELVEHAAQFVRLHPDREWADVELERHHSETDGQKIFKLSVPVTQLVAALLLLFLFAAPAKGQDLGNVGLRTINSIVANAATCTGTPQLFSTAQNINTFRNLGQTSHLATATSTASQFQMEIDGIDNLGNVFRLSDLQLGTPSSAKGGLVVTAAGYMTTIQIAVTCSAGATFSISYSGSFSPQPPNLAGALLTAVEKLPFQVAAANATSSTTFQTPGGNSSGTIVFQYSGAGPAGSSITAQCITNSNTSLAAFTFPLSTTSNPQLFAVTQSSCPFVNLTYTSGGASAVTYNLEYVFNVNGAQQTLSTANSGPSSTLPIQVVSDSLGQAFFSTNTATNPANNTLLLHVNANSGVHSLYFDKVFITSTAATTVNLETTNSIGTTCTTTTLLSLKLGTSNLLSTALENFACTGLPGNAGSFLNSLAVPANSTIVLDLRGFIAPNATNLGMDLVLPTTVTGTVNVTFTWYEK